MIKLSQLSLQRGSKILLSCSDLTIYPGQSWGLIGANGSGKSSLFKLLLGQLHVDGGDCHIPKSWQVAHMAQEVASSDRSATDYVLDGDKALRDIQEAIACADDDGDRLATLYEKLESVDGYSANARAEQLLHGLGFSTSDQSKNVKAFSGGWRIRLNLAQALMCRSDLLLLDEPTNHLDLDATLWLESWLQKYSGTLFIISHDRDFLDNVVDHIVNIEGEALVSYTGHYSAYEKQKAERLSVQRAAYEKQQTRISEIEDFVRRFRAKATKAKQAQSRLKELERMEKISPAHIDSPFSFTFPAPDKIPPLLLTLDNASVGYGDKKIVDNIELSLMGDSRIGLLGHNGAGKSTLMKTLSQMQAPISGERIEGAHVKIGYFAQHQLEALDLEASCALHLQRITPGATEQAVRNFLGSFGFQGDRAFECIRHFSGGEKARLSLAIIAWQKPNLLLLDEPTNHLDLEVRHALTLALQRFEGAIVVVSHDRHLLKNTVDEFMLVDAGRAMPYTGDLDDYQSWLLDNAASMKSRQDNVTINNVTINNVKVNGEREDTISPNAVGKKADKKEQRQTAAAKRQLLKPLSQAVKKLEREMSKTQERLNAIEVQLVDESVYGQQNDNLTSLLKEQGTLSRSLESLEEQWLQKSEELEEATNNG